MRMERDSFPDADVIDHAQRSFVPLKLRSDVHEGLALGFNLSGLPATVLVTPTREIIAIRQGYLGPDELDQLLSEGVTTWRGREAVARSDKAKTDAAARGGAASTRPAEEPRPALAGYCPVSLIADRKLVAGKAEHSVRHAGQTYRFATAAMSDRFRKDPERYIPANGGDCPVTELDGAAARPGNPRWGVLYQGRLYVCASDDARRRFLDEPERYAMVDVAEQGFCRTASPRPASWSAATPSSRSPATACATGSPTPPTAPPSWPRSRRSPRRRRPKAPHRRPHAVEVAAKSGRERRRNHG